MRRPHYLDITLLICGGAMLVLSGLIARWTAEWSQAALLTIGAAVVLGVALRWVAHAVREATKTATTAAGRATAAATAATHDAGEARDHAEAAAASEARVRADLKSLDERIAAAMAQDQHPVVLAARAAVKTGSPSSVRHAIQTARDRGTLGAHPPIVEVAGADDYWVRVDALTDGLLLHLGRRRTAIEVEPIELRDDNLQDALIQLGHQVKQFSPQLEPAPQNLLVDVPKLLELGSSHELRHGLFARYEGWGATPGHVVSLNVDRTPPHLARAGRNIQDPYIRAPRDLKSHERRAYSLAQEIALAPGAWFNTPRKSSARP